MSSVVLSVSPRPAAPTAVTSVERAGLFDAAVATGSRAMPSKLPAPQAGTAAHAAPNGASIIPALGAMDSGAIDSGAIDSAAIDSGAIDGAAVEVEPPPDEQAASAKAAAARSPPMRAVVCFEVMWDLPGAGGRGAAAGSSGMGGGCAPTAPRPAKQGRRRYGHEAAHR